MSGRGKIRYTRRYQALFSEDQWRFLAQVADDNNMSVAELLRQFVDEEKERGQ